MNRILVSLVSEQTVPNVLVAEHFRPINFYGLIVIFSLEQVRNLSKELSERIK